MEICFQDLAGISHLKPVISQLANHVNVLSSDITWKVNLLVRWSSECTCSGKGLSGVLVNTGYEHFFTTRGVFLSCAGAALCMRARLAVPASLVQHGSLLCRKDAAQNSYFICKNNFIKHFRQSSFQFTERLKYAVLCFVSSC